MHEKLIKLQADALKALNRADYPLLHRICSTIVQIEPKHADAWFFMSIVAAAQQKMIKAVEFVDRALTMDGSNAEYLSQKAKYHCLLKQDSQALESANEALKLSPQKALVLDTLGVVYTNLGFFEKAKPLLQSAVDKNPNNAQFRFNFASVEQFLGEIESAKAQYRKAIEIAPNFARAYWALSEIDKERNDSILCEQLEHMKSLVSPGSADALYIAHALYREYEKLGKYDEAFHMLAQAKERYAAGIDYSFERDKEVFDALLNTSIEEKKNDPPSSVGSNVIFVVGMPRSGTTLLERMLGSHGAVTSLGELQNFAVVTRQNVQVSSASLLDKEVVTQSMKLKPHILGEAYLNSLIQRMPQEGYFVDKMPLNFLYIGLIRTHLPGAKIVCLRRHPLDTCLSNYRQLFATNAAQYYYNLSLMNTAHFYCYFDSLMKYWNSQFPGFIHEVVYEDLVANPRRSIQALLDFIGLPWEESCIDFHEDKSAVATPSATQVRERLYSGAIGRWEKYRVYMSEIKKILDEFGIGY